MISQARRLLSGRFLQYALTRTMSTDSKTPSQGSSQEGASMRKAQVEELLRQNKYVLFMKGVPEMPLCGYSNFAVEILKFYKVKDFKAVDIMKDEQLRDAVKEMSEWPTFPQFYVSGKLIGGCDIMHELHKEGKLKALMQ